MDYEKTKLPSKAQLMYARRGNTQLSPRKELVPPSALDPDVMQRVLQDLVMKQHREQMEQRSEEALQGLENMRLPQGQMAV